MTLAWGILAALPLQRLLDLYYGQPVFEKISQQRLGLLHGLSLAEYQQLVERPGWNHLPTSAKYVALCSYQGELSDWAPLFVPGKHLARRAELLQDVAAYRLYMGLLSKQERVNRVLTALRTDNAALQAVALTMGGHRLGARPEDISWSRGLVAYYRLLWKEKKISPRSGVDEDLIIVGYLGLQALTEGIIQSQTPAAEARFLQGYFLARAEQTSDGLIRLDQDERDSLRHSTAQSTIEGGLPLVMAKAGCLDPELVEDLWRIRRADEVSPYSKLMDMALKNFRSKLIPFLASKVEPEPGTKASVSKLFPTEGQRAKEIVGILGAKTPVDFRICAGAPLSIEEVRRENRVMVLLAVSHPQVVQLTQNDEKNFALFSRSHLLYEPLATALYRRFGQEVPVSEEVYARGLLTQIIRLPTFANWTFPPVGRDLGLPSWDLSETGEDIFPVLAARFQLAREIGWRGKLTEQARAANLSEARKFNLLLGRAADYRSAQYLAQAALDQEIRRVYQVLIS